MRAGRRCDAAADPAADHAAARGARPDLGRHLLLHAVLERVHLRARLHPEQRQQDRPGRDPHRTRLRRRLSVGRTDGGLPARLAAGRSVLLAVRRLLRLVADRCCKRIALGLIEWRSIRTATPACFALQPLGTITTPLSLGQRTRHAKEMSLTSPGLASKAHSSTPRLSRRLVVVGGVVDDSISTWISSFSLTG